MAFDSNFLGSDLPLEIPVVEGRRVDAAHLSLFLGEDDELLFAAANVEAGAQQSRAKHRKRFWDRNDAHASEQSDGIDDARCAICFGGSAEIGIRHAEIALAHAGEGEGDRVWRTREARQENDLDHTSGVSVVVQTNSRRSV